MAAAGLGVRLGGRPKACLRHGRHTLLELAAAYLMESYGRLLIGLPGGYVEEGRALLNDDRITCFPGGATKQDTVALLIAHATELLERLFDERDGAEAVVPLVRVRHRAALADALEKAAVSGWQEPGVCVLVHRPGGRVRFVESRHEQLKITYPEYLLVLDPA